MTAFVDRAGARALPWLSVPLIGAFFAWRLSEVPSRLETVFLVLVLLVPLAMKLPRLAVYYLLSVPCLVPLLRRLYYMAEPHPPVDFLMLLPDGMMAGLTAALALLWASNKEKNSDILSRLVLLYTFVLFLKVFVGNEGSLLEGLYGFKFNGLYILFFFAGCYLTDTSQDLRRWLGFGTATLALTAVYSYRHIGWGPFSFEQLWLDSVQFTTLYIQGKVRPFSTYASPAALSDAMSLLVLWGLYRFLSSQGIARWRGVALMALAIPPILFATVRTNWLAVPFGIYVYLVFLRFTWARNKLVNLFLLGILAIILTFQARNQVAIERHQMVRQIKNQGGEQTLSQVFILQRTNALRDPLNEYSLHRRLEIWASILDGVRFAPLGKGQGTTGYAHSYYFQILGETGPLGLALFLLILWIVFRRGIYASTHMRDPADRELACLLLAWLAMISMLNLTGTHLHSSPGDFYFWFSAGAIMFLHRQCRAQEIESEQTEQIAEQPKAATELGNHRLIAARRNGNPSG